jgi:SAM-dependent methyltransferase
MDDPRQTWEQRYRAGPQFGTPSAFVARHAALIRGRVLDIAAGSGRNALFLAGHGAHVDMIDIAHAGLTHALAGGRTCGLQLNAVQADLTNYPLPANLYEAIVNVRYLQRSLFAAFKAALKPNGILLFETFLIDQRQLGHPRNPEFLLQRGELSDAFADFEILEYREGLLDSDPPAYLAQLAARRPRNRIEFSNGV